MRMTNPVSHDPTSKPERLILDTTSWVDLWRGWHYDAGATFGELARIVPWKQARLWRYDHYVTEPRLGASLPEPRSRCCARPRRCYARPMG